ncbi:hypothetical protein K438DRAFT_2033347 [Mycena galopus ATCC 62051]|nr:hypothetical protein K438DRAFT_2033347 [Mycena galopus ATCC 62051]
MFVSIIATSPEPFLLPPTSLNASVNPAPARLVSSSFVALQGSSSHDVLWSQDLGASFTPNCPPQAHTGTPALISSLPNFRQAQDPQIYNVSQVSWTEIERGAGAEEYVHQVLGHHPPSSTHMLTLASLHGLSPRTFGGVQDSGQRPCSLA